MTKKERQKLWETRLAKYRASGQSVTAWCREYNVNPQQLWYWRRKEKQPVAEENAVSWLPVDLSEIKSQSSLLVRIGPDTSNSKVVTISRRELRWLLDGLPITQRLGHPEVMARTIL